MADISAEIAAFRDAAYGEDVRSSMISLANKLNGNILSELNIMQQTWNNYKDDVDGDISDLNTAWNNYKDDVDGDISDLNTAWNNYKDDVDGDISDQHTAWDNYKDDVDELIDRPTLTFAHEIFESDSPSQVASLLDTVHTEYSMENQYDLGIADDSGNILFDIGRFVNSSYESSIYGGLSISDDYGNVIADFNNGRTNTLCGKTISIIGDSISTYEGWIPEGYAKYYPKTFLDDVDQTWWKKLINETDMRLIRNCSWGGSRVTGDSGNTTDANCASSDKRVADVAGDNNESPDFIIVYISVNDFRNNIPFGEWSYNKEIPENGTTTNFTDAYMLLISKLHTAYPLSHIFCCTILPTTNHATGYCPILNGNGVSEAEWNQRIKDIASSMNCSIIDFYSNCAITVWNIATYAGDGALHPNSVGASRMARIARTALEQYNGYR